jgi:hypothetical protein
VKPYLSFAERQRILCVDQAVKNLAARARMMAVTQANVDKLLKEILIETGRLMAERKLAHVAVPDVVGIVHPRKIAQVQFILRDELAASEREGWTADVDAVVQKSWPRPA